MPISFRCGVCLGVLSARDEIAGKAIHCPKCKALLEVPALNTPLEQQVELQPEDAEHEAEVIPRAQAQRMPPVKMELAEDEEEEDQPRRKSSSSLRRSSISSRRKFKPKRSESRAVPLLLLIGGCLMALSAVILLVWVLGFRESAPAKPPAGWKDYTGEGFTCWIPDKVVFGRNSGAEQRANQMGGVAMIYSSNMPTMYGVSVVDLQELGRAAVKENASLFLKGTAEGAAKAVGGQVITGRSARVDGHTGYEVEVSRPEGKMLLRLTHSSGYLYTQQLTMSDLGSFDDPRARPFFESFHITR